jgi:hypothetical protein
MGKMLRYALLPVAAIAAAVCMEVAGVVPLIVNFAGWTTAGLKRGRAVEEG